MKPRGPLMIEHRLIEAVIGVVRREIAKMREEKTVDPLFLDTVVDFVRTYADRTHHGKEEDILFAALEKKQMPARDRKVMEELIEEHKHGRALVGRIVEAEKAWLRGDKGKLSELADLLSELADFYPRHIEKEDRDFFPSTEKLFSEDELAAMLREFHAFDAAMIHEKYRKVTAGMGAELPRTLP
ncbi:MAG: hemerythrin domain-containing protein [Thermodesulfobacteriota bacterium]